jgi:hypothetical protein
MPVCSARPASTGETRVVTMRAPKIGGSPSSGRPALVTTSTPMTHPTQERGRACVTPGGDHVNGRTLLQRGRSRGRGPTAVSGVATVR